MIAKVGLIAGPGNDLIQSVVTPGDASEHSAREAQGGDKLREVAIFEGRHFKTLLCNHYDKMRWFYQSRVLD